MRRGGGRSRCRESGAPPSFPSIACSTTTKRSWQGYEVRMRDQSLQPSQIIFPSALQPAEPDESAQEGTALPDGAWGWLEIFVLVQVLWGVLLFVPGSQAYRAYIRGFPYVSSLIALAACIRSRGADSAAPGARWIIAVLA